MADGTYERRGPREAELKRFARLIATCRLAGAAFPARPTKDDAPSPRPRS